jgi:hypothetical protein
MIDDPRIKMAVARDSFQDYAWAYGLLSSGEEPSADELNANPALAKIWKQATEVSRLYQRRRVDKLRKENKDPSLDDFANPIFCDEYQLRRAKYFLGNNTEPTLEDFVNPVFCKHWEREKRLRGMKEKRDRFRKMIADGEQPNPADLVDPLWEKESKCSYHRCTCKVEGGGILDPFICGRIFEKRGSSSPKCKNVRHIHPDPSKQAEGKKYQNRYSSEKSPNWSPATKDEYLKQKQAKEEKLVSDVCLSDPL